VRADSKEQRVRVYLDGLDEIPSSPKRLKILEYAQRAIEQDKNLQLIVTSREYVYGREAHWLPMLRLSEFDDKQSGQLIGGWLSDQPKEHDTMLTQLDHLSGLKPLMKIPLLATLVILVFRQTRRLPENRTRL
jgi:predicted NACHT family NTPase